MKTIKRMIAVVAMVCAFALTASAQLGEPQTWLYKNAGGWSNVIGAQASATVGGQTNLTRLDIPENTRSIAIEFDGYLMAASTAGTNVTLTLRKSVAAQGNASGTWLTSHKGYTNTEAYATLLFPVAAGASRVYGTTNLNMTAGSGLEYYPYLYAHRLYLGYTDNGPLTNWQVRVKFQKAL